MTLTLTACGIDDSLPSENGRYDYLSPKAVNSEYSQAAYDLVHAELGKVLPRLAKIKKYSVFKVDSALGQRRGVAWCTDDNRCEIYFYANYPDCGSGAIIVHEMMHLLIPGHDSEHKRSGLWATSEQNGGLETDLRTQFMKDHCCDWD